MKSLMLVSAAIDPELRRAAAAGERPMPEYLSLESRHGVELVDWTDLGARSGHRSVGRSLKHVAVALDRARKADVVFSDGEHIGIPLALAMQTLRIDTPHVMIGHNLLTPAKTRILRHLPLRPMDRVLVHSSNQVERIVSATALSAEKVAVIPYGVDTKFWSETQDRAEDDLVVAVGREHRDYRTLVEALPSGARLTIADHSLFSPQATRRDPEVWPPTVERVALDLGGLRQLYARAAVVIVPLVESPMPAGITTVLEAMSMGKAVVVSETSGLKGTVTNGDSGLTVQPGDAGGLQAAIEQLLGSPSARQALGTRARRVASEDYDVDVYADALSRHLAQAAALRPNGPEGHGSRAVTRVE